MGTPTYRRCAIAMNRVQFQRGVSMSEFFERYGNEEKCEAALFASCSPSGWRCPICQCATLTTVLREGQRYRQCGIHRQQSNAEELTRETRKSCTATTKCRSLGAPPAAHDSFASESLGNPAPAFIIQRTGRRGGLIRRPRRLHR